MKKNRLGLMMILAVAGLLVAGYGSMSDGAEVLDKLLDNFQKEHTPPEPLLPPNVTRIPEFKPGVGPVVGNVQMVQGDVVVIHKGESLAYSLQNKHPLFVGDTLISGERSRLNAKMVDNSVFAMAPVSKLVIDQPVHDPAEKETSSLSLLFGRARFVVGKLSAGSGYQVKAPTAVCGVRGSDFALSVTPSGTTVSSIRKSLASIYGVREACAKDRNDLLTTVVTGPGTTVAFSGILGPAQTVGPASVCSAASGGSAISPIVAGPGAAMKALDAVGPGLASVSVPPG